MSDDIFDELREIFEISQDVKIEFKEIYGLTFAFESKINIMRNSIVSTEIAPLGIIYEENDEYYFAPLDEVENINEIIKEYVKTIPEGECSHSQQ